MKLINGTWCKTMKDALDAIPDQELAGKLRELYEEERTGYENGIRYDYEDALYSILHDAGVTTYAELYQRVNSLIS